MIAATLTKVLAGVALVGALATTVFAVLPHPESTKGIWLDTPLADAVVEAGEVRVVLHSDLPNIIAMYVDVTRDGTTTAVLKDAELERVQRGAGAKPLSVFDQIWAVDEPGVYTLNVSASGSTTVVRSFEITVRLCRHRAGQLAADIDADGHPHRRAHPRPRALRACRGRQRYALSGNRR
jgi:hypothetical protein